MCYKHIFIVPIVSMAFLSWAFADDESIYQLATTSYVTRQNQTKQDMLDATNVIVSGTGTAVTNITVSEGTLTIEKSNPATLVPIGSADSTTTAKMWLEL